VPSNIVIAVAGNVQGEKLKDIIEKLMENQPKHSFIPEKTKPVVNQGFIKLLEKDTEQIQICVGVEGLSYHDERRFAQNIMNSILGGGMSSRLFQKLREELGLAYSIYSYPSNYSDTGSYLVYIGTGPARIAECLDAMFDEVKSFIFHGITEQELERTQKLIKSSMYLGLESVMSRMSRLGKSVMMYDRIVNPEETIAQVFAVTQSDIMELALDILGKQSVSIAAIGPGTVLADLEKEYKKYGLIKKTVSRPGI
jgi:predicted Zn-dependent peptidase